MDILKWLVSFLPRDPNNGGGFGPFKLPESADWMNEIFVYHDLWYDVGPDARMSLADIDWRVFKTLTMIAEREQDMIQRCHKLHDICRYWPIMHSAGHYLYNRNPKPQPS